MKNISSLIVASILTCGLFAQNCTDLFISEYVEGSSNNKALELYNPTNEAIDLSKYSLSRWSNGATTPLNTVLSGTIEALIKETQMVKGTKPLYGMAGMCSPTLLLGFWIVYILLKMI